MNEHLRGYQAVADELARAGVDAVFGLMGDDTAAMVADLDRRGIRFFAARHENIAVNMADGYAWASGRVGVCFLSRGPGFTNAITAATTAVRRGSAVLVITGEASDAQMTSDPKYIDQGVLAKAAGLNHLPAATADDVVPVLRACLSEARSGRPSLFTISPMAQALPIITGSSAKALPQQRPTKRGAKLRTDDLNAVTSLLAGAQRPLVLAGAGAVAAGAHEAVTALAEHIGALLGTTLLAKDWFSSRPDDLGIIGGFSSRHTRQVLAEIDVVLVLGAGLSPFTTEQGRLFAGKPVVQVDHDPAKLSRTAKIGVVGDVEVVARQLLDVLPSRVEQPLRTDEMLAAIAAAKALPDPVHGPGGLDPTAVAIAVNAALPANRTLVTDGGHSLGFPAMHVRVPGPDRYRLATEFGAVGMGLGVGIGAALGTPTAVTVVFVGDGALSMSLGDLETAARLEVPMVIVVMNDRAYGAERHFLELVGLPHRLALLPGNDFAAIGAAMGLESHRITTADDLANLPALLESPRTWAVLLDCVVDPDVRADWLDRAMGR